MLLLLLLMMLLLMKRSSGYHRMWHLRRSRGSCGYRVDGGLWRRQRQVPVEREGQQAHEHQPRRDSAGGPAPSPYSVAGLHRTREQ